MHVSEIDTPALVVDLDIMERNLARVADYARQHNLRLRPHTKTHKSIGLGRRQLALGAAGLTVAKVSEAEVMALTGTPDLLIAYPILGHTKLARLTEIARRTSVTVAVDSAFAARQISDAARAAQVEIGILAEVDVGLGRVGVPPGELVGLAQAMEKMPHLKIAGITFYPGHIKDLEESGRHALAALSTLLQQILADLRAAGIHPAIVSGGSTPTLYHSHEVEGLNEIRPGTYVFNDVNTVRSGACALEDCAAAIHATVVSTPRPGHMIIDGGSKTFSSDRLSVGAEVTFGRLMEAPGARFYKMNEEHGYIDITHAGRDFQPGDRVRVIPNHICVAINLHELIYGIRNNQVEAVWKVDARGKLQ
jgi:D-serine deaminase-like pyridoxal phosphate-dependent protein